MTLAERPNTGFLAEMIALNHCLTPISDWNIIWYYIPGQTVYAGQYFTWCRHNGHCKFNMSPFTPKYELAVHNSETTKKA